MPLYEYRCKNCGHQFEKIQSFSAPDEKECPLCHGPVERLISASAIQFKGSGWYATDYASRGSSMKASADGDGKTSETKSAEKPSSTSSDSAGTSSTTTPSSSTAKSE